MEWEYLTIEHEYPLKMGELIRDLRRDGDDGWELVVAQKCKTTTENNSSFLLLYKRPKVGD